MPAGGRDFPGCRWTGLCLRWPVHPCCCPRPGSLLPVSDATAHSAPSPAGPFFRTPAERAQLAREKFFARGERPTGLVSEAVIHSWNRCRAQGHGPGRLPTLDPVSASSVHAARHRHRALLAAAESELAQLESSLSGTGCRVLLINPSGVVIHATSGSNLPEQRTLDAAGRVGVQLAEDRVGTTAPGIVLRTGQAVSVCAGEHFFDRFGSVHCAASAIFDADHRLAGVLDVSTESQGFGFDMGSLVGLFATAIENRLLCAQADEHLVLRFQTTPALLDTPLQGLMGISGDGQVVWINGTGRRLLGEAADSGMCAEAVTGLALESLIDLVTGSTGPQCLRLPTGLGVWVQGRLQWRDGLAHGTARLAVRPDAPVVPAHAGDTDDTDAPSTAAPACEPGGSDNPPTSSSLADIHRALIDRTLAEQGGNIARTARALGVSRGLLYRHLRRQASTDGKGASVTTGGCPPT